MPAPRIATRAAAGIITLVIGGGKIKPDDSVGPSRTFARYLRLQSPAAAVCGGAVVVKFWMSGKPTGKTLGSTLGKPTSATTSRSTITVAT